MKKLLASIILANVASSAFAVPPSGPQPLLGEAQGTETVPQATPSDVTPSSVAAGVRVLATVDGKLVPFLFVQ